MPRLARGIVFSARFPDAALGRGCTRARLPRMIGDAAARTMTSPDALHDNARRIEAFYAAFAALDAGAMAALYAEDVRFEDPAFSLDGREAVMAMWTMLCEGVKAKGRADWSLDAGAIRADAHEGSAHWEARYRFGATGRLVHNRIDAAFVFRDGLVVRHTDRFDLWAWSRQALGAPGWLLGWSGILRGKVRAQAAARLGAWRARAR
jgi:ketosteroid isomerase-like protein